jgi:DNA invertase Pin-like site-specific DNA recombinase
MRVAIYARVSTEAQEARGTIGSQVAALRERVATEGHEVVSEFLDDGHSGARLDRPGLDALRDAAEAGLIDALWCLSPDRLARVYAYQVIVLEEFARLGVAVFFADAPNIDDDPQARLLTQVQGVIAEYERAKIAERYRRGKLWRSRAGEIIAWKASYGYRRVARSADRVAHLEVFEPEAQVVRRVFDDYVASGHSTREIARRLNSDRIPTATGKAVWGTSAIGRMLHNEAYVGRVYFNKTESVPGDPDAVAVKCPDPDKTGYRSRCRPSSRTTSSKPPVTSAATTRSGVRAGPSQERGYCAAWSAAAPAVWAWSVTRCEDATARFTAITTAATTTRFALEAKRSAAPNATSDLTSSMPSCSNRCATR